jgi:hypothetical protein
MMKKILAILCLFPSFALAVNDDISDRPELGTAVITDSMLAVNAGEAAGSRLSRILFTGSQYDVFLGNGTWTTNPAFNSLSATGGNVAAANVQVVKQWLTGLSYTADATAVVQGGMIYICKTTHTAGTFATDLAANRWELWGASTYLTPTGSASSLTVVATGFNGNLATTDDTVQEIAQKFDDFTAAGTGDMILANAQSVTGAKTFDPSMLKVKGSSTGVTSVASANTGATNYTATLPAATGTVAYTSDIAYLTGTSFVPTGAVDMSGTSSVTMGPLSFEGATADDYETTFSITDPTADRTVTVLNLNSTIPAASSVDASGKILSAGLADTPSANGISLFTAANYAAMRTLLDLESGTDFNVAASTTVAGIVELAIDSEVNTGTSSSIAVTPDSLSQSYAGTKEVCWMVKNATTVTAVADGLEAFVVPASMNGMNLIDLTCAVADLNSAASGSTTVVLRRVRGATAADMTSTGVTIAYNAYTESDETVDTSNDDLATGDHIYVDVNAVTSAVHKGLSCTASFRLP